MNEDPNHTHNAGGDANLLQPGVQIRPFVNEQLARQLVKQLYGLECVKIKQLNGYDDKNFFIQVSDKHANKHISSLWPHGYVLKVMNSLDSKNQMLVDGQNSMMVYLAKSAVSCPQPVPNLKGEFFSLEKLQIEAEDEWTKNNIGECPVGEHIVRLLTYIPGKLLHEVTCTEDIFYKAGKYIGYLDNVLKAFSHPGYETHRSMWMMESLPGLHKFLFAVEDKERQQLVHEVIDSFQNQVLSKCDVFEKGMIHGDINEQNILVSESGSDRDVCGILDFGDSQHSCYLFELAISICYMMMQCKTVDPLNAGGYIIAGYLENRKIPRIEFNTLKVCVAARYCQSLVLGAYSYHQDPENKYILTTAKTGWEQLSLLWKTSEEDLYQRWKIIIKKYNKSI